MNKQTFSWGGPGHGSIEVLQNQWLTPADGTCCFLSFGTLIKADTVIIWHPSFSTGSDSGWSQLAYDHILRKSLVHRTDSMVMGHPCLIPLLQGKWNMAYWKIPGRGDFPSTIYLARGFPSDVGLGKGTCLSFFEKNDYLKSDLLFYTEIILNHIFRWFKKNIFPPCLMMKPRFCCLISKNIVIIIPYSYGHLLVISTKKTP